MKFVGAASYQNSMEPITTFKSREIISLVGCVNSLVTAVPVPLISRLDWEEVGGALVLHFLGEPQEDSEVDVSHGRSISRPWMDHRGNGHELRWKVQLAELVFLKVTECKGFVPLCLMLLGKPTQNIYVLAGHHVGGSLLHNKIKHFL